MGDSGLREWCKDQLQQRLGFAESAVTSTWPWNCVLTVARPGHRSSQLQLLCRACMAIASLVVGCGVRTLQLHVLCAVKATEALPLRWCVLSSAGFVLALAKKSKDPGSLAAQLASQGKSLLDAC